MGLFKGPELRAGGVVAGELVELVDEGSASDEVQGPLSEASVRGLVEEVGYLVLQLPDARISRGRRGSAAEFADGPLAKWTVWIMPRFPYQGPEVHFFRSRPLPLKLLLFFFAAPSPVGVGECRMN